MRSVRVTWVVVTVLGFAAAFFVPLLALPFLGAAALIGRRLSRAELLRRGGRLSAKAMLPPVLFLVLVLVSGSARWRGWADWNFFGPYESLGPEATPSQTSAVIQALMRSPVEHLVWWDPWFAGVLLPVLLLGIPVALALAVALALRE